MRYISLATLVAFLVSATPAAAANVVADPARVLQVMRAAGYSVELKAGETDQYIRASKGKESYKFSVFFTGCDEKSMRNCKSVQFFSAFSPKKKPTLEAMNAYARDNRWGRIYLDKVQDPVIEMDLDLEQGGMSEALFLDNLEYFKAVTERFATFAFMQD